MSVEMLLDLVIWSTLILFATPLSRKREPPAEMTQLPYLQMDLSEVNDRVWLSF